MLKLFVLRKIKHEGTSKKGQKLYIDVQYNTVKPNLKGSTVLLRFRDSFGLKIAKIKEVKSGLDISFGSSNDSV